MVSFKMEMKNLMVLETLFGNSAILDMQDGS